MTIRQDKIRQMRIEWRHFAASLQHFERQLDASRDNQFAFWFSEGSLIQALKEGHWILLDEINLASSEALERLSGVLDSVTGSITLLEKGESEVVERHPDFRLFANMNPPTDFGKKDLPPGIRARFSEVYVADIEDREDLQSIIHKYLADCGGSIPLERIVDFYLSARRLSSSELLDASNMKPHYSVRTLCRSLSYVRRNKDIYGFERCLFEGLEMSFLTPLKEESRLRLQEHLDACVFGKGKTKKKGWLRVPPCPGDEFALIDKFWIRKGQEEVPEDDGSTYILTPTIEKRLRDLARVIQSKYPILLQGPTSSGKTSLVEYLAINTGHKFVRINNHEHTDIQEYMGTYVSNADGKLSFQEGALVEAVRNGYWIVLDELNLAPSEVLEALNRLLDDNRELFIAETQETIKAHPDFLLFATQNPPGIYGGRKVLSRAFQNRFIQLNVGDIPEDELITIIEKRCGLPPSYCKRMVSVMKDLQKRRDGGNVFDGKRSFITPRDLFRWGSRQPGSYQELAEHGFMLLGERLRTDDGREVVKAILSKHCKHTLNDVEMYSRVDTTALDKQFQANAETSEEAGKMKTAVAWTDSMKRLYTLIFECLKNKEPVLLVGETGCGKTTICQLFAVLRQQLMRSINCHQHTETAGECQFS